MRIPDQPKIYHITHLRNLRQVASSGWLWSDAMRIKCGLDCKVVGMTEIKRRRLQEIEVTCHPGTKVGEYAPFYFCPRSIMLYILHRANHPDLDYSEGQQPIVHLEADLRKTIDWADDNGVKWVFSDRNAGVYVASFYHRWDDLDKINWAAVASTDFRSMLVKEGKQAEFLLYEKFPWTLVEKVGVINQMIEREVRTQLTGVSHLPSVTVEPGWYF